MATLDTTAGPGYEAGDAPTKTRRDFLVLATAAAAAFAGAAMTWPLIDTMNPAADVLALSTLKVDLSPIVPGQRITVLWRGQPVFVVHRTPEQIARARKDDNNPNLIDPQPDSARVQKPEWLIVTGICTHLGCVPQGQKASDPRGPWGGWYCSCHGSIYDISGRVRRSPAPENLWLLPYKFLENGIVQLGEADANWVPFGGKRGGTFKV